MKLTISQFGVSVVIGRLTVPAALSFIFSLYGITKILDTRDNISSFLFFFFIINGLEGTFFSPFLSSSFWVVSSVGQSIVVVAATKKRQRRASLSTVIIKPFQVMTVF